MIAKQNLLEVDGLRVHFRSHGRIVRAVEQVSFSVDANETLAIVGESGCGKSVAALSMLRLLPRSVARVAGSIRLDGTDLLALPEQNMRRVRGNAISMVFQEPMTSLNPVLSVGWQIAEPLRLHKGLGRDAAARRTLELLDLVGIADPAHRASEYPHQLSGGMRQRVMIAMALACEPRLLIADEPTTALDVTVQAQILELMADLQRRLGTAVILITHDLGVVAEVADRVVVMYAGRVVEQASVKAIVTEPRHPYTQGLLRAVPRLGASRSLRLNEIPGRVPSLSDRIVGCAFADRCPMADSQCREAAPELADLTIDHQIACHQVSRENGTT